MQQSPALRAVCQTMYSSDPEQIEWTDVTDLVELGISTVAMARDQLNGKGMVPGDRHMEFIAGVILGAAPVDWQGQLRGRDAGMEISFLTRPSQDRFPETPPLVAKDDRVQLPRNFLETVRPEPVGALIEDLQVVLHQSRMVVMNLVSVLLAEAMGPHQQGVDRIKVRAEAYSERIPSQTIQIELAASKRLKDHHQDRTPMV